MKCTQRERNVLFDRFDADVHALRDLDPQEMSLTEGESRRSSEVQMMPNMTGIR